MAGLPSVPRGFPPRFVARGQLGQLRLKAASKDDIRAPPGHVGSHRYGAGTARLGDDFSFPLMEFGVQHLVGNAPGIHGFGQALGGFDGRGAHQHGLAPIPAILDVLDNGVVLLIHGEEN